MSVKTKIIFEIKVTKKTWPVLTGKQTPLNFNCIKLSLLEKYFFTGFSGFRYALLFCVPNQANHKDKIMFQQESCSNSGDLHSDGPKFCKPRPFYLIFFHEMA